jgi:predicted amidohydrolase
VPRSFVVAAAQMGPVQIDEPRKSAVARMIGLLEESVARGASLVAFPEAALTAFFPHWLIEADEELDGWFEAAMPNDEVAPLFDRARQLGVAFSFGYGELVQEDGHRRRFNTSVLVDASGEIVGKYRKIHLPGFTEVQADHPFENLEKRYFEVGDLGFRTWDVLGGRIGLCICNDRRWPETFRVLGLQGAELVLTGYNTPHHNPAMPETDHLAGFHNHLSMQAGAYQNGTWVVGVAKAGIEAGVHQIGGSCIIAPSGEIVALARTEGDEVITAQIDLDACTSYKTQMFNFAAHRRPEHYGAITQPIEPG